MSSGVPGTNQPPISFPGISSGIDYNSIIKQLTSLTLAPSVKLNQAVATLNAANVELVKINNLLQAVQTSLQTISNPNIYNAYSATSSDTTNVSVAATGNGVAAIPGAYTVTKVQTATSTSVTSNAAAGHSITDNITSGVYAGTPSNQVPLVDSYAAVAPTNGGGSVGQITVDGVSVSYNVNTQSVNQILAAIQAGVVGSGTDLQFTASLVGGKVVFASTDKPISVGSASDKGNILDVFKLTDAQLVNGAASGSITGTSDVGGISDTADFGSTNSANYKVPVTNGYFTINGAKITVTSGNNTSDILTAINQSSAGVVATYDADTNQITLTSTKTGPTGIVLGQSGDTSNFLTAAGLTAGSGATIVTGSQSEVDVQTASGGIHQYFSNSNTVTSAIQGVTLTLQGNTTTPFVVNVSQTTTALTNGLSQFVSAYNNAVREINAATAAPVVITGNTTATGTPSKSVGGGILFGNSNAEQIVQQLTNIVGGFLGSGSSYNSLPTIGVELSDSFQTFTTNSNSDATGGTGGSVQGGNNPNATVQATTYQGTDGTLQPLKLQKFAAAFAADPNAVEAIINGSNGLTNVLGSYLATATGAPTILDSGLVGNTPTVSIIQNFENANTDQITQYQAQIQQITDNANQQADSLRSQFVASEGMIAQLQAEQQQLAAALGFTISSSSSGS